MDRGGIKCLSAFIYILLQNLQLASVSLKYVCFSHSFNTVWPQTINNTIQGEITTIIFTFSPELHMINKLNIWIHFYRHICIKKRNLTTISIVINLTITSLIHSFFISQWFCFPFARRAQRCSLGALNEPTTAHKKAPYPCQKKPHHYLATEIRLLWVEALCSRQVVVSCLFSALKIPEEMVIWLSAK